MGEACHTVFCREKRIFSSARGGPSTALARLQPHPWRTYKSHRREPSREMADSNQLGATLTATAFTSAALYCSLVEHPARSKLDAAAELTQWKPSYKRAALFQSILVLTGSYFAWAAYKATDGEWRRKKHEGESHLLRLGCCFLTHSAPTSPSTTLRRGLEGRWRLALCQHGVDPSRHHAG